MTAVSSVPQDDPQRFLAEIRELQAVTVYQRAEIKVLRHLLLKELARLGVHALDGKPVEKRYSEMIDEELRVKFAKMSDDDPSYAAFLERFLATLRQRAENEHREGTGQ
jgi:hypothetical protein